MLLKCPECDLQVSDKALICPHCGFPLAQKGKKKRRSSSTRRRRRLPNGFGSITKVTDQYLREPFRVRVTVGKDPFGKPILKNLKPKAMFSTYNEAYEALVEYSRNPYDLDDDITVSKLYEKWTEEYFSTIGDASQRTIKSAWAYCSSIYSMRAKDVRARHIKGCMNEGYRIETRGKKTGEKVYPSAETKSRIKSLFNLMLDYALEYELVEKNYARTFEVSEDIIKEKEENVKDHIIFTEDELALLWENVGKIRFVDWILIQMYMGWRPQELATIRLSEIHMDEWYACAGMKTDAGKQRIVPIHSKIKELVKKNYDEAVKLGSDRLFNDKGETHSGSYRITYDKYNYRFKKVISALNLNSKHRPHDPRKTFITRCKKAGVDEYALKEMVGHSVQDITESVYTVRDLEWLRADLEKMQ